MKLTTRQLAALVQVRRQPQTPQTQPPVLQQPVPQQLVPQQHASVLRTYIKHVRKVT